MPWSQPRSAGLANNDSGLLGKRPRWLSFNSNKGDQTTKKPEKALGLLDSGDDDDEAFDSVNQRRPMRT